MLVFNTMTTQQGGKQPARETSGTLSSNASEQVEQLASAFRPAWEVDEDAASEPKESSRVQVARAPSPSDADASSSRASTASQHLAAAAPMPRASVVKRTMIGLAPPANLPPSTDTETKPPPSPQTAPVPGASGVTTAKPASVNAIPAAAPATPPGSANAAPAAAPASANAVPVAPTSAPGKAAKSVPAAPKSESRVGVTSAAALANALRGKASCEPKVIVAPEVEGDALALAAKTVERPAVPDPTVAVARDRSREEATVVRPPPAQAPNPNGTLEIDEAQIMEVAAAFPRAPTPAPPSNRPFAPAAPIAPISAAPISAAPATVEPAPVRRNAPSAAAFQASPAVAQPANARMPSRDFDDGELQALVPKRSNGVIVGAVLGIVAIGAGIFFVGKSMSDDPKPAAATAQTATATVPPSRENDIPSPSNDGVEAPIVATETAAPEDTTAKHAAAVPAPENTAAKHASAVAAHPTAEAPAPRHAAVAATPTKATSTSAESSASRPASKPATTAPRATAAPKSAPKTAAGGIVRDDPF